MRSGAEVWHAIEMDGWNYSLSLSNLPSTFLTITPLPSLSFHPPLPPLPSLPSLPSPPPFPPFLPSPHSMQAIQNLGLAVVAIVAGKIVDVKGYLVYEVFNCALLCCESTLATQGVAWGWGIHVHVDGLTTPTVQCHASHPYIQTLLGHVLR